VAERTGYIYQRQGATIEELRELVDAAELGWAWTPARMYRRGGGSGDDLLQGDEGRVCTADVELRWRRAADGYDLLVLALAEQALAGFSELRAGDQVWRVERARCLLLPPFDIQHPMPATSFLAPDGSTQFVALIGAADARGSVR
jgi:hypothetical protein